MRFLKLVPVLLFFSYSCLGQNADTTDAEAALQRGLQLRDKGDKSAACFELARAHRLCDTLKEAGEAYYNCFCWMQGMEYFIKAKNAISAKDYNEGIENINFAIELCPDSGNYYAYRGICFEGKGNKDSALLDYTIAVNHDPKGYMGYYKRGIMLEEDSKFKDSFDDLSKAIEYNPDIADAYLYRAEDCENMDMEASSIYDYRHLISLDPKAGIGWYKLGLYNIKTGRDSCSYFQKALDLGIEDAQHYVDECNKYEERKNLK